MRANDVHVSDTDTAKITVAPHAEGIRISIAVLKADDTMHDVAFIALTEKRAREFMQDIQQALPRKPWWRFWG